MRFRRRTTGFEDMFYGRLEATAARAIEAGADLDEVEHLVAEDVGPVLEFHTGRLVRRLVKVSPRVLRYHRRLHKGFKRRLRRHWGKALDQFYALTVAAEEAGSWFRELYMEDEAHSTDLVFEALSGLHARACRTAFEVHWLLTGGLPMGALARCRTLHELAVVANVIFHYGRMTEHADLAERYLLHHIVLSWKDALEFQRCREAVGRDTFTDDEMASMQKAYEEVVERFGKSFQEANGWAANVTGKARPNFTDLERLAGISHLRTYYKWASHEVHADAKGWRLNIHRRGDLARMSSGYSNFGFADPGQLALISLLQCTTVLLLSKPEKGPRETVVASTLQRLLDDACQAFLQGHRSMATAENFRATRPGGRRMWFRTRG